MIGYWYDNCYDSFPTSDALPTPLRSSPAAGSSYRGGHGVHRLDSILPGSLLVAIINGGDAWVVLGSLWHVYVSHNVSYFEES